LKCVQKKFKIFVDAPLAIWQISPTHGTSVRRTHTEYLKRKLKKEHKMRTKTLLLSAAALLSAGFITTQAQVYSQNVVGYANVASQAANLNYLESIPFAIGASNGVNEIFGTTLPLGSRLLKWNQGTSGYDTYYYDDPGDGAGWLASDDATHLTSLPKLPTGEGFFLVPAGAVTNTYAGTITVNVGTSNNMVLANANLNYLLGSVVPYAGAVTNGTSSGGGPNLNGLPLGSRLLIWNQATSGYDTFYYDDPGDGAGWLLSDDATHTAPPSVNVAQGFFLVPAGAYTWTTGL
jgi:hypothetical protein